MEAAAFFLPMISSQSMGLIPVPGLLVVMLVSVNSSPFAMSAAATILFRATAIFGSSKGDGFLIPYQRQPG